MPLWLFCHTTQEIRATLKVFNKIIYSFWLQRIICSPLMPAFEICMVCSQSNGYLGIISLTVKVHPPLGEKLFQCKQFWCCQVAQYLIFSQWLSCSLGFTYADTAFIWRRKKFLLLRCGITGWSLNWRLLATKNNIKIKNT